MTNSGTVFRWLLAGAAFAVAWGISEPARAEVSVGVNINLGPPPIVVSAPPAVVMIPGSQVHFVPDPQIDVFFYGGYWWSPRGEQWYRARAYNGPWGVIEPRRVPPGGGLHAAGLQDEVRAGAPRPVRPMEEGTLPL